MEETIWSEEEAIQIGERYCERNGFELLHVKKLKHESDHYLRIVMAYSESAKEYCTWLLNLDLGGLHRGHYFSHYFNVTREQAYKNAFEDFLIRN